MVARSIFLPFLYSLARRLDTHTSSPIAPGGAGNKLELHRDTPNAWDGWDIDEFYRRNVSFCSDVRSVTLERGGWDAVVVVERLVGSSPLTQRISLAAGSPSLTIVNRIDWQEFIEVIKGNGPCNKQRLGKRRNAHEDGEWVREAASAYATKQKAKEAVNV